MKEHSLLTEEEIHSLQLVIFCVDVLIWLVNTLPQTFALLDVSVDIGTLGTHMVCF